MARQRAPEGPAAPAPVQRLRIQYAKRGRMRFSSTRDFQRALERALRRAAVPMAFSSGFHPHPRISYANAAPTGMASEAEYVEIAVVERLDPEAVRYALDDALPTGYDVVKVVEAQPGSLSDRLEASLWELRFPGVPVGDLERAVEPFREAERVEVVRTMNSGERRFDAREPVLRLTSTGGEDGLCAILHVVVRHTTPSVRPDDILTAIRGASPVDLPPPVVRRLAQGPLSAGSLRVGDPLSTDQGAIGT